MRESHAMQMCETSQVFNDRLINGKPSDSELKSPNGRSIVIIIIIISSAGH